ncbi:hypothetical protein BDP81DRAFT_19160 [Colletotrichum phormii]|uniref:Uncharacterized protein n=1 Tax=Colletotrichum phormii TaxID=359342 RepID=A0AAJ0A731_9PEZI|nr:uncharacterized protein BDP81DRAFT_19160 [Colletotrichum phormii]KAK1656276.1 hypothetical protein BDP81DRAFT_19160 [Colletotrichum phormii]
MSGMRCPIMFLVVYFAFFFFFLSVCLAALQRQRQWLSFSTFPPSVSFGSFIHFHFITVVRVQISATGSHHVDSLSCRLVPSMQRGQISTRPRTSGGVVSFNAAAVEREHGEWQAAEGCSEMQRKPRR